MNGWARHRLGLAPDPSPASSFLQGRLRFGILVGRQRRATMPTGFGYKCAWIAAKADAPLTVATALGLRNLRQSAWDEGIAAAYERASPRRAFITPLIDGWILCVSTAFFRDLTKGGKALV